MNAMIYWPSILAQKAFWIYYLRLFQGFDGDYVVACCAFFGITRAALETTILRDLYQTHRDAEDEVAFHTLRLPTTTGAMLEISFHPYGPGEQFTLAQGADAMLLAEVDVDDVCVPRFPLRDLPAVAARLSGDLAQTYGALLLYKLTYVAPEDDLDALGDILRAALPPGLFSDVEQAHILGIERSTWQTQQKRPRPLRTVDHPLWRQVVG